VNDNIWILRYKHGLSHVQTGFIRASDQATAEAVGRAYCGSVVGMRYVHVSPAILADESILGPAKPDADQLNKAPVTVASTTKKSTAA
jgi:hypothetical protein